jgi:hypothetical protein
MATEMKRDLTAKLRDHLASSIDSERDVVYLAAEVRKLLERDDPTHRMDALWMYCHWALHIDLDSLETVMEFLKRLDTWVTNKVAGLLPTEKYTFLQEHYLFKDLISLDVFKTQLATFFTAYSLPTEICDNNDKWFSFILAYCAVIEDGSLILKPRSNNKREQEAAKELRAVKQVTIMKGEPLFPTEAADFRIQWMIELKDGRSLRFRLSVAASGMGSHDITLLPAPGATPQAVTLITVP